MHIGGVNFNAEFFREMFFGPDLKETEKWSREYSEKCEQIRKYREDGTRPTNMKCAYDDEGRMIWNEATGCCGPATYIER